MHDVYPYTRFCRRCENYFKTYVKHTKVCPDCWKPRGQWNKNKGKKDGR